MSNQPPSPSNASSNPTPPPAASPDEHERELEAQFAQARRRYQDTLWALARFYSTHHRPAEAMALVKTLGQVAGDPEIEAQSLLAMGQLTERLNDYAAAITFYSQALALEPTQREPAYFINNNLGYCLNRLGRHDEAEPFCREAIRIDPTRHNAYKNLGIALGGQGDLGGAARNFVQATRANASDPRALDHLEHLLTEYPELLGKVPGLADELEACREAVAAARRQR